MKFRMGFVSNSSTSSFCLYGAFVDDGEWDTLATAFLKRIHPEMGEDELSLSMGPWELKREAKAVGGERPFPEIEHPEGHDGYYIGVPWTSIGDDETGRQFQDRVEAMLKGLFPGVDFEFDILEEAYYG